jgi:hypothetical protein
MTRLSKQEFLIFSRETQLESGEHHIDALDSEGVPIRLRTKKHIPGTHFFTSDGANAERDGQ